MSMFCEKRAEEHHAEKSTLEIQRITTEVFHFSELRLHALNDLLFISSG